MGTPFSIAELNEARRMRAAGCSYRVIAESLGRSKSVIQYHLNDKYRDSHNAACRKRSKTAEYKKMNAGYSRNYHASVKSNPKFRAKRALRTQRADAQRRGHLDPTWTVDEVVDSYDGKCYLCGVPECECNQQLCVEHNHETGEFRGWACVKCNVLIGFVENHGDLIDRFREMHDNEYSTPQP